MHRLGVVVAALMLAGGPAGAARAQDAVVMTLPTTSLTFATHYVAHDAGFYEKEGLAVTDREITGVGALNAVIGGSADFTGTTGSTFLRAVATGQELLAIANLIDRPMFELVLRKDVAEAAGIAADAPLAEKSKAIAGKTIAIQGVGSIIDTFVRLVARAGGLDPDADLTITPLEPPAMLAALEAEQIDGYATSIPWTTQAVVKGSGVTLVSGPSGDLTDYDPFNYVVIATRPQLCAERRETCAGMARALAGANAFIADNPDKAFEIIQKRFAKMDPDLLKAAWESTRAALSPDVRPTEEGLGNAQRVSVDSGVLKEADTVKDLSKVYTDEFLR